MAEASACAWAVSARLPSLYTPFMTCSSSLNSARSLVCAATGEPLTNAQ